MTQQLYMQDAYLKECDAEVTRLSALGKKKAISLDKTVMQPSHRDGGDRGNLVLPESGPAIYISTVVTGQPSNDIEHLGKTQSDLAVGMKLKCIVDWDSRYTLMRRHTGNHILYGCAKTLLKVGFPAVSKTSLGSTYTHWIDQAPSVDEAFIAEVFTMANEIIREERRVLIETLPREAALEKCGRYHEAVLPRSASELRIVTIEDLDSDPCIGLHVRNVSEIGGIKLLKIEREGNDIKVFSEVV